MYVYLTRHGETLWNLQGKTQGAKDIALTESGIRQAEVLAERLVREDISKIYSSGLNRAFQTASIIGNELSLHVEKRHELNEINFGIWEGLTRQEIDTNYPGQLLSYRSDFEFAPNDGESLRSLQIRIKSFFDSLLNEYGDTEKRILLVAHAYPMRMLIMELMGLPKELIWRYQLSNCGISVIRLKPPYLLCLNDTTHLAKT
ncbi:MAG: histidine phosphatase family protein [Clostridiales bacterium]|jgi:probable phosphoglycerate mutase|nr:histidine phosphatase family protein [Clostridiales bacterium]